MTDRDRLATLLHDRRVGCLEDLPGDPVTPGDDRRTHLRDAHYLIAAGVRLSPDASRTGSSAALQEALARLEPYVELCPACHHEDHDPGACEHCPRCELHTDEALAFVMRVEPELIANIIPSTSTTLAKVKALPFGRDPDDDDHEYVSRAAVLDAIAAGLTLRDPAGVEAPQPASDSAALREDCRVEPALSQHEYVVDYCETHDQPADQCAAIAEAPVTPAGERPLDVAALSPSTPAVNREAPSLPAEEER